MVQPKLQDCKHTGVENADVKYTKCAIHEGNSKPSGKFTHCSICQRALKMSMKKNKIKDFLRCLSNGANVNCRDSDTNYSVFEIACKTPRSAVYIGLSIAFGARINEINFNYGQSPVHLVVESMDVDNLSALLSAQDLLIENQNSKNQTALCMLFETITQHNYNNVWNCIKLLLEYHANINIKNSIQKTPIQLVLENESLLNDKKIYILEFCLLNYYCNIDENTKSLIQSTYSGVKIPEYTSQHELFDQLRDVLNCETVEKFLAIYQQKKDSIVNLEPEMIRKLLQITIYRGKPKAAEKLLELKSVEGKVDNYQELLNGLLKKCCVFGDVEILQQILDFVPKDEVEFLNKDSLLSILVDQMGSKMEQSNNRFYDCMEILLEDDRIEIDKRDGMNRTALEFAGEYKNERAQRMLLAKGAYVGGEDLSGGHVLGTINLDVLQNHLDSCVTGSARQMNSITLEVNVMNFVPPQFKSNYKEHKYQHSNDESFHNVLVALIEFMECDSSAKKIILHPVVLCLLNLKFTQLWFMKLMEVVLSMLLVFGLFWYASLPHQAKPVLLQIILLLLVFSTIVSTIYMIIHFDRYIRVRKLWVSRIIESGLELIVRVLSILYLFNYFGDEYQHVLGAYIILGSGIVVVLALRTIAFLSIGPNILKFFVVLINLLKYVITFGIVLVAFAMSFHVIHSNKIVQKSNETLGPTLNHTSNVSDSANSTVTCDDQFNTFADKLSALLKVVVMMTGEVDSGDMHLTKTAFAIIFTFFVFGVAIAFYNLLTGLVVRDVAILEEESTMLGVKEKIIKLYEWNIFLQYLVCWLNTQGHFFCVHINTTVQYLTIELKPKDIIVKTISLRKPEKSTELACSQETAEAALGATSNIIEEMEYKHFARYTISKKLELALKEIVDVSK